MVKFTKVEGTWVGVKMEENEQAPSPTKEQGNTDYMSVDVGKLGKADTLNL